MIVLYASHQFFRCIAKNIFYCSIGRYNDSDMSIVIMPSIDALKMESSLASICLRDNIVGVLFKYTFVALW